MVKDVFQIAQGSNGGFGMVCLVAVISIWLLYRGTVATLKKLRTDLEACELKHASQDEKTTKLLTEMSNIRMTTAALWTLINMSGDRRGYQLPPLDEVLAGRIVIGIKGGEPDPKDRRAVAPPLVFAQTPSEGSNGTG